MDCNTEPNDASSEGYDLALWRSLCAQLRPDDTSLYLDIELSISKLESYFETFEESSLAEDGDDIPDLSLWLVLVDGLASRGYLAELDWRLEADELAFQLEELVPCKKRGVTFSAFRESCAVGEQLLVEISASLREEGLTLLYLYIDSDSYPLVVVPSERVSHVQQLASLLGERIEICLSCSAGDVAEGCRHSRESHVVSATKLPPYGPQKSWFERIFRRS